MVSTTNGLEIPSIPRRRGTLKEGASATRTVSTLPVELAESAPGSLLARRNESPTDTSPIWYWVTRAHELPNLRRTMVSSGSARRVTRSVADEFPSENSVVGSDSPFPIMEKAGTESREARVKADRRGTNYRG